jgi:uncharacterized protein
MSDQNLFTCTQCGDCCKGYGGTYLTASDVVTISRFVGVSAGDFQKSYCALSGQRLVLAQRPDGYCIFFDDNCTIHAVKPRMCRQWPFIESVFKDPANWRIMAGMCPGMVNEPDDDKLTAYVQAQLDKEIDDA